MPNPERPERRGSDITKTVTLTEKDLQDAARLFRLFADPALLGHALGGLVPAGDARTTDRLTLLSRARMVINSRRAREKYFDRDLFGEPAWDILLALYITEDSGSRFTISKLAECIDVPLSTAIRWVRTLEQQSLVERIDHPTDRRIAFVRLKDEARRTLDAFLGAMPG